MDKTMHKLNFIVLSLLIITGTACQKKEIPGLVAAYSFSGDASDQIGNGNDAVVTGATLTSDRFGNPNSAYFFNGTSAYILAEVKNMPAVDAAQTISWWFMVEQPPDFIDSLGADNMIALVDTTAGVGVQAGYRAPGYHSLGLDAWYWGGRTILESQLPSVNEWHHCVYTFDGQSHSFYLDGQQVAKSAVKPQTGTPDMLMFGNYPGGDQYFAGSLDDVLIYDRALSSSEIKLLYKSEK
jgi:hypothetical protein